jgi:hypothetical protein
MVDLAGVKNAIGRQFGGFGHHPFEREVHDGFGRTPISAKDDEADFRFG